MRFAILVVMLFACSGGGGQCPPGQVCTPPPGDDPGAPRCAAIPTQLQAALDDRGTCVTDNDCMLIGGQFEQPTCNCAPFAGDCSGVAVARNAPQLATAQSLIAELAACELDCSDGTTICACDCSPATGTFCDNGTCFAVVDNSCFGNLPDAGLPSDAPTED